MRIGRWINLLGHRRSCHEFPVWYRLDIAVSLAVRNLDFHMSFDERRPPWWNDNLLSPHTPVGFDSLLGRYVKRAHVKTFLRCKFFWSFNNKDSNGNENATDQYRFSFNHISFHPLQNNNLKWPNLGFYENARALKLLLPYFKAAHGQCSPGNFASIFQVKWNEITEKKEQRRAVIKLYNWRFELLKFSILMMQQLAETDNNINDNNNNNSNNNNKIFLSTSILSL